MQIRVGKRLEHITAARAGDGHDATLIGDVGDGDILAVEDVVIEPVLVVGGRHDRRVQVIAALTESGDRHLALDTAEFGEHVHEAQATVRSRDLVGADPVEQRCSIGARDFEFGERREIGDADALRVR